MTTETTHATQGDADPLETVMGEIDEYILALPGFRQPRTRSTVATQRYERLRLHVQLALAKARAAQQATIENLEHLRMAEGTDNGDWSDDYQFVIALSAIEAEGDKLRPEITALEARIGEAQ